MKVFGEFYEFNRLLILNFQYGKNSVEEVAADFPFVRVALDGKSVLSGNEGEFLQSYVDNLGYSDASSQLDYLNERSEILKKYKEESLEDYRRYGSLYIKISLAVGILIAVLLA